MNEPFSRPPSPTIRGAIFDVGNVLIQLRPMDFVLRMAGGDRIGVDWDANPLQRLRDDPVLDLLERGRATEAEFFEAVRRCLSASLEDSDIRSAYLSILGRPMPGMAELIGELRARGMRVVGLTDISPGHLHGIMSYPAVALLDDLIASCRTGHRKPEAGAYRAALAALGTRPEETLFVDDRPENVVGAAVLGLHALEFHGVAELREELKDLLGGLPPVPPRGGG